MSSGRDGQESFFHVRRSSPFREVDQESVDTCRKMHSASLGSEIIFTKFDLRQLIRARIIAFFMLIRYVTLWPWPLTHWPQKFMVHQASRGQSLYKIWLKSSNPRLNYWWFHDFLHVIVALWPWPLTSWPLAFTILQLSCVILYKMWAKSNNQLPSYRRFCTCNFRGGAFLTIGSQVCVDPTLPNLRDGNTRILFQSSDILLRFQMQAALIWVMLKKRCQTFWPPVKIRGVVGQISIPIFGALPMTKSPEYIWRPTTEQQLSTVYSWKRKEIRG